MDDDHLTERGALQLAKRLAKYWIKYPTAKFRVVEMKHPRRAGESMWCVRSNLVNGVPPHA
jgi:hypothetical protein